MAIIGLFFALALLLPVALGGSAYYMTGAEVAFEVVVYAVFLAITGVVLGAILAAAAAPFLFFRKASARQLAEKITQSAVILAAFLDLSLALKFLLQWAHVWGLPKAAAFGCYYLAFAAALLIPRRRKQLGASLNPYLGERATRRAVIGTGLAAAGLVAAESVMGKTVIAAGKRAARPSGPNVLLVTFDALSAEDMSLYGYRLPTTPHLQQFARNSSVFTNFYSASTFTTASLASVLTGQHPSEHGVYHLPGRLLGASARRTLPRLMRAAGYSAGASVCNPAAYFLAQGIADDYDVLPEPAYRTANFMRVWNATQALHQRQPMGSRTTEFWDMEAAWDYTPQHLGKISPRLFAHTQSDFSPAASFAQAQEILGRMPDGYFLWVHVFAPHAPYLPDAANLGRFLPSNEMRTAEDELPFHQYSPAQQALVDKARLRYNEFIAESDSAFGSFVSSLEGAGRLQNTAVIVSADHGESFEGGVYSHDSLYQTRSEIHIPLMIRLPGQEIGSRVNLAADQTALAPTILDIAGMPRADWMRGQSLVPWLKRNGEGEGEGLAFTQYLATNSIFKPISKGTVGVIDGQNQFVLNLATGKGILRSLAEAQSWNFDRSAENPALAQKYRDAIYARFPDLPRRAT